MLAHPLFDPALLTLPQDSQPPITDGLSRTLKADVGALQPLAHLGWRCRERTARRRGDETLWGKQSVSAKDHLIDLGIRPRLINNAPDEFCPQDPVVSLEVLLDEAWSFFATERPCGAILDKLWHEACTDGSPWLRGVAVNILQLALADASCNDTGIRVAACMNTLFPSAKWQSVHAVLLAERSDSHAIELAHRVLIDPYATLEQRRLAYEALNRVRRHSNAPSNTPHSS